MSKEKRRVPKLRFPGFTEDWEQRKLNDLVTIRRGLTYKPSDIAENGIRVLRSSNIDEDQFITSNDDVFVNIEAVNIPFAKNGDILITSANGSNRLVGKHTIIRDIADNSAVHGGFMLLAESNNPLFTDALLSSNWYKRFINTYVAGGNGAIGNLSKSDLESQIVMVPSEHEQAKIGQWYDNINQLITLHQRKLDNLKLKKKALLQKLFPKNGERYPELRFPEFTDAWEQREFSDIFAEVKSGLSRMLSNDDIGLPVVRANNINDGQLNLVDDIKYWYKNDPQGANTNNYLIEQGDILINFINSEAKMGTAAYVTRRPERDTIYTTNILRCKVNDEYNPYFIYSLTFLNSYKNYIASITKPAVNQASFTTVDFKKYSIKIPTVKEQNQIADLIETFNKLITLHQRKLDHLQLQKKALLQQMFV